MSDLTRNQQELATALEAAATGDERIVVTFPGLAMAAMELDWLRDTFTRRVEGRRYMLGAELVHFDRPTLKLAFHRGYLRFMTLHADPRLNLTAMRCRVLHHTPPNLAISRHRALQWGEVAQHCGLGLEGPCDARLFEFTQWWRTRESRGVVA